jgi:hypothetical protein
MPDSLTWSGHLFPDNPDNPYYNLITRTSHYENFTMSGTGYSAAGPPGGLDLRVRLGRADRAGLAAGGKVIFMPPCLFCMENR